MSAFGDAMGAAAFQFLLTPDRKTVYFNEKGSYVSAEITLYNREWNMFSGLDDAIALGNTELIVEDNSIVKSIDGLVCFKCGYNLLRISCREYQRLFRHLAIKWAECLQRETNYSVECHGESFFSVTDWIRQLVEGQVPAPVRPSWPSLTDAEYDIYRILLFLREAFPDEAVNPSSDYGKNVLVFSDLGRTLFYDQVSIDRIDDYLQWRNRADVVQILKSHTED
jgi:hypothetical protein